MKKIKWVAVVFLTISAAFGQEKRTIESVSIDTILHEAISIRAILADGDIIWYAADKGRYGFYNRKTHQKFQNTINDGQADIEFRSIAKTSKYIYLLNVGNPAKLYQISKDGATSSLVYQETHEKVFYDSMQFWNDNDGIAVGDPIDDCLSILLTHDGGSSWKKLPCSALPRADDGEAAFAASNTNIVVKGKKVWIVSGGQKARVFYSPDQATTWQVYQTPVVQGLAMTGIFSCDFYDQKTGFIAGGNYELPNEDSGNKATTTDGGKTWKLIAQNQGFGYASCVQFVPEGKGKKLVSVGPSGFYYSDNGGKTWKKLLEQKDLYTIRFLNPETAVAAGRNGLFVLHFK